LISESTNPTDQDITPLIHGRVEGRSIGFSGYTLPEGLSKLLPHDTLLYKDDNVEISSDKEDGGYLIRDVKTCKLYGWSTSKTGVVGYVNANMKHIRHQIAMNVYGNFLTIP
jgi:hypothetical protein